MDSRPWLLLAIGVLVLLLAVVAWVVTRGKKRPTDYYALFIMGIIWLPIGIAIGNTVFFIIGLVFMLVGLANKDKWKENRVTWDKLSEEEKKARRIIIAALAILVFLGVVVFYVIQKGII